jgi:hypothetical protein
MIQFKNISKIEQVSFIIGAVGYFLVICLAMFFLIYYYTNRLPIVFYLSATTTIKFKYTSQLDGRVVKNEADQIPQVVTIMIDNYSDARPQYGLAEAKVVYEAPVEGGLTRFMAVFEESQKVDEVGPVRSARPYYLDWLEEYSRGLYMHSGGSPDALSEIDNRDIFDANEFYWGEFYWRSNNHYAPHNLFTKSELWQEIISSSKSSSSTVSWDGWKFGTISNSPTSTELVKSIQISYMTDYVVGWEYVASTTRYSRSINNQSHIDNNDGQGIMANNILVQYISLKVLDNYGRLKLGTISSGEARVLRKGEMIRGTWKKESISGRTRFYDKEEKEIILTPGITWVQVVPEGISIEVGN